MVKIIGILRLEYTLNYDEIKIRMLENVGRFVIYDILRRS